MLVSVKYLLKVRRKGVIQEGNDRGRLLFFGCKVFVVLQGQICIWMVQILIVNGNVVYVVRRDFGCSKSGIQFLEFCFSFFYLVSQELDLVINWLLSNIMCLNFKKRCVFEFLVVCYVNMLLDGVQMFFEFSYMYLVQFYGFILFLFYFFGQQFYYIKFVQFELMVENFYSFLLN